MENGIHFISGLPRAGSTLLAAILRQNPKIYARMSGPVGGIYMAMLGALSNANEFALFMDSQQKEDHLRSVFEVHYREIGKQKMIFDTNRVWCAKLPALTKLFPNSYFFCCVRNLAWIMDSMERLIRKNAFDLSRIYNFERSNTVYGRIEGLAGGAGMVGFAHNAIREAFYGEQSGQLVIIRYDSLAEDPGGIMEKIYALVGEKPFKHDFENLDYSEPVYDSWLGTPGLHTVRPKVTKTVRKTILPPDLFKRFNDQSFWDKGDNPRGVTIW
ncbi:MAG: sulfotransferase [Proteobacteria bacterium]|nr:sulfotransferase [Pseudomonadota bacterium]